jgi:hypothetical protein
MKSFPGIDPFTYKRKEPWLTPIEIFKLSRAQSKFKSIPYNDFKQSYLETKYNIPSDKSLAYMRDQALQFRSSEAERPVKKGYEFKILKA